jgi:eukaryotic-like serine/threonine-protein kinase
MPLAPGTVLENRYRILAVLGEGGMGAVYRAVHLALDQEVAIKENRLASPASARQFEREARMMARLRHHNLPRVGDHFVTSDGAQCLVMDYIEGEDLGQVLKRTGPLSEPQALAWIGQVCDALAYLHSQEPPIIHRDIKPSNIKITPQGQVFLVDFGIAKVGDAGVPTATGALGVTPGFSPPEQYGSGGTDERSDVYALGATLYALLTGKCPPESVQRSIEAERLTPPRKLRPDLSPAVTEALEVALNLRPTDRPQTVAAFRRLLQPEAAPGPEAVLTTPEAATVRSRVRVIARAIVEARRRVPVWAWAVSGLAAVAGIGVVAYTLADLGRGPTAPAPTAALVAVTDAAKTPQPTDTPEAPPGQTPDSLLPPAAAALGDTWMRSADGMTTVYVPAGEFGMGSTDGEFDEKPVHTVALGGFWIDRTEVTVGQFAVFVAKAGHRTTAEEQGWAYTWVESAGEWQKVGGANWQHPQRPDSGALDDHPVVQVSWDDAAAYCAWAGSRLPTEAEWEYAARGPDGWAYPWGDTFDSTRANYCDATCTTSWKDAAYNDGYSTTAPVGSYPAGASWCGALDLAGNVWESVADWYGDYPSGRQTDPRGPSAGEFRMMRGGAWDSEAGNVRAAFRNRGDQVGMYDALGFRCVMDPK